MKFIVPQVTLEDIQQIVQLATLVMVVAKTTNGKVLQLSRMEAESMESWQGLLPIVPCRLFMAND